MSSADEAAALGSKLEGDDISAADADNVFVPKLLYGLVVQMLWGFCTQTTVHKLCLLLAFELIHHATPER